LTNPLRTPRGRLATAYACLALIAIGIAALYSTDTVRRGLHDQAALDLTDEARLLADQLSGPVASGDTAAVNDVLQRAETLTHARLMVTDAANEVVAGQSKVDTVSSKRFFGGEDAVQVSVPIWDSSGQLAGTLQATDTLDETPTILGRINAISLLLALGALLTVALIVSVFSMSVANPANRVAQAALALANRWPAALAVGSDPNQPFPAPLPDPRGSADEIRALVHAFNSLGDQLRVYEQARREFASDVSHELHSLASAMKTAAEALDRGAAEANPALGRRLVEGLVGHTRRLTRLADDLLELARWEGGRLTIDAREIDLTELVRGTLDEWTPEAGRRQITLQVRQPMGPLPLQGDPIRLAQALGNLIENALKYAGQGGWVRVDVAPPLMGSYEMAITDSGPGIPLEVLPRVFERYFRVEGRLGAGPGGMGLGLAIARAIVLAHGGELTAESPRGGGARFVMRLPVPASATGPARPLVRTAAWRQPQSAMRE
jgi:signal transduction histidine kinase